MEIGNSEFIRTENLSTRVNMDSFKGLRGEARFSEDQIRRDKITVLNIKESISKKHYYESIYSKDKSGEDLEVVFCIYGQQGEWFGKNALLTRASEFDDFTNGTDFYLEFRDPSANEWQPRMVLAIDTTTSKNYEEIDKKFWRNMDNVKQGTADIKYFKSKIDGFMGGLHGVVPVIVGVQRSHIDGFLRNIGNKQYFKENPDQIIFLKEIKSQLECYSMMEIPERVRKQVDFFSKQIDEALSLKVGIVKPNRDETSIIIIDDLVEPEKKKMRKRSEKNLAEKRKEPQRIAKVIRVAGVPPKY
jgi:hypothetical protein